MGDQYRAGQRREDKIRMAGFGRTSKVRAFGSGLQKGTHVLHFGQAGFVDEFRTRAPMSLLIVTQPCWRARRFLSSLRRNLLWSACSMNIATWGTLLPASALMAGASFAKDIKKVQGMQVFAKSGYWQGLAVHMLDPEKLAEFGEGTRGPGW